MSGGASQGDRKCPPLFDAGFISYTAASERRLVDVARTEQLEEN
jgi:hypothetical protein